MQVGGKCYTAQEDVKDLFYRLGIESDLGKYFGLPRVQVGMLRECVGASCPAELVGMDSTDFVEPTLSVLPMGFSWAFWVAQQVHLHIATQTLGARGLLVDRSPPPRIESADDVGLLVYADNANKFGMDQNV